MISESAPTSVSKELDQKEDASATHSENSGRVTGSGDSVDPLKSTTSGSINFNNQISPHPDLPYHDDFEDLDDYLDVFYCDDDGDSSCEDDYLRMQSLLDKVDLPAGVEASFPWLKDSVSNENMAFALSTSTFQDVAEIKRIVTIPDLADGKRKGTIPRSADGEVTPTFRSTSSALGESSFKEKEADGVMERFQCFKQFDIVDDFLDHHFKREGLKGQQPCSNWAKKI